MCSVFGGVRPPSRSPSAGSGWVSGDAGVMGMCPPRRANVSSSGPDVSSFRPDVSTFRPNVSSFGGNVSSLRPNVSTLAGDGLGEEGRGRGAGWEQLVRLIARGGLGWATRVGCSWVPLLRRAQDRLRRAQGRLLADAGMTRDGIGGRGGHPQGAPLHGWGRLVVSGGLIGFRRLDLQRIPRTFEGRTESRRCAR